MTEFEDIYKEALNAFNYIISNLKNDKSFYEEDIEFEYSPFEVALKHYCDSYCDFYINNNLSRFFLDSLISIVEIIVDFVFEDVYRPVELIIYYFGKIISSDDDLRDYIPEWVDDLMEDYFIPFIEEDIFYPSDEYYTSYPDFVEMISVFKYCKSV